jgi:hypothetical protein
MEENQKHSKILEDCAEVSKLLSNNKLIINSEVTVHIPPQNYPHLLNEMEEYVKIRVDKTQSKISLKITDTEFIFIKT